MTTRNRLTEKAELDRYGDDLAAHLAGTLDAETLRPRRLHLGVYLQRHGDAMVRVKLPGGLLRARQLLGLAETLEHYSEADRLRLTSRQNVQIDGVPLARTEGVLRRLALHGLTTREAAGNTVRTVTACPLAGACPQARVDVQPYVERVTRHFLRNPQVQALPRKFKLGFTGCAEGCNESAAEDLQLQAVQGPQGGGFRLLAGGALGAQPQAPTVLDPYLPEADLLAGVSAVIALHAQHNADAPQSRARVRHLVKRWSAETLRSRYQEALAHYQAALGEPSLRLAPWRTPGGRASADLRRLRAPIPQADGDRFALPVEGPAAGLDAAHLRALHAILRRFDVGHLRLAASGALVLLDVAAVRLEPLQAQLARAGFHLPRAGSDVRACVGTHRCGLALTDAGAQARRLDGGANDLRVRVSGCPNGCAHSAAADIGLVGRARRHHGQLVPSYSLQLGGGNRIPLIGPSIPAARAEAAVKRLQQQFADEAPAGTGFSDWVHAQGRGYLNHLLADLTAVTPGQLATLARDHGAAEVFQVAVTGGGCGTPVDPVTRHTTAARHEAGIAAALAARRRYGEAAESLHAQGEHLARALLAARGHPSAVADPVTEALQRLAAETPVVSLLTAVQEAAAAADSAEAQELVRWGERLNALEPHLQQPAGLAPQVA